MLRNHTTSPTPLHLRRGQKGRQEHAFQRSAFTFGNASSYNGNHETLNLSMHLPSKSCSNRFEVLAAPPTPAEESKPSREFVVPNRYRRSRNSRGTKEAKRRRDARRSRRKMAEQMLDDQLSRDIDATLAKINTLLPHVSTTQRAPTPILQTTSFTPQWPQMTPQLPPTPPQLPMLDFYQDFSINAFPELATPRRTPTPPTTHPEVLVPSWCPTLPFMTRKGIWSDGLPTFYDLSALPEPKEAPKAEPRGLELQLWSGGLNQKRKVSRFFPPPPSTSKPIVKLPTSCKLHMTEKGLSDGLWAPPAYSETIAASTSTESLGSIVQSYQGTTEPIPCTPVHEPSAANLWRILANQHSARDHKLDDTYLSSFTPRPHTDDKDYHAAWQTAIDAYNHDKGLASQHTKRSDEAEAPYVTGFDPEAGFDSGNEAYIAAWQEAVEANKPGNAATDQDKTSEDTIKAPRAATFKPEPGSDNVNRDLIAAWQTFIDAYHEAKAPIELDGKMLPYVHANSLTGPSNEVALSPYADEHPTMRDSAVCFTPLASPPIGLNELMVDYDVGEDTYSEEPAYAEGIHTADAYLEEYTGPPLNDQVCVLADFLPIDCMNEENGEEALAKSDAHFKSEQELFSLPALPPSPAESVIDVAAFLKLASAGHATPCGCLACGDKMPELVARDKVMVTDDEWTLCASPDSISTATTTKASTEVSDDEKQTARIQCGTASEWEVFFPSAPGFAMNTRLAKQTDEAVEVAWSDDFDWEFDF